MFTVCPKCTLTLAVTAADLRAGQGYVRCGRCANVFNALLALSEETAPAEAGPRPAPTDVRSGEPRTPAGSGMVPAVTDDQLAETLPGADRATATASRPALPETAAPGGQSDGPAAGATPTPVSRVKMPATGATGPAPVAAPAPAPSAASPPRKPAGAPQPGVSSQPAVSPQSAAVPQAVAPQKPVAAATPSPAPAKPAAAAPQASPALRLVESPPRPFPATPVAASPPVPTTLNRAADDWDIDHYQGTGTFETIVLEGDTFLQTEELVPEEALDSEIADVSRRIAAAQDAAGLAAEAGDSAPAQRSASATARPPPPLAVSAELRSAMQQVNQQLRQVEPSAAVDSLRSAPRARPGWMPLAGAALLALLLVAQAINHWRNDLATRTAWYGPLSRWSALLGEPLRPNWDLAAYDVHQLGGSADSGDNRAVRVRLSLANRSDRPQGMPLLRVTLLDRYGKALSAGELTPAQYLPAGLRGARLMAREQRVDTELTVLDPTQQASSFELDVCVAAAGGGIRCASETAPAASPK